MNPEHLNKETEDDITHCVVLVALFGSDRSRHVSYQTCVNDCITQIRLLNPATPIYVITEAANQDLIKAQDIVITPTESLQQSEEHRRFLDLSTLAKDPSRNYFWKRATERFYFIDELIRKEQLENTIHLESDNLLYAYLPQLAPKLRTHYAGLGLVSDNGHRVIPGFVYIHDEEAIHALISFMDEQLSENSNDMDLLGRFCRTASPAQAKPLPILPHDVAELQHEPGTMQDNPQWYASHAHDLGGLFDGAALGQYLGGIDPRNRLFAPRKRFINESCIFSADTLPLSWNQKGSYYFPYVSCRNKLYPVYNLHMHSKNLKPYMSHNTNLQSSKKRWGLWRKQ